MSKLRKYRGIQKNAFNTNLQFEETYELKFISYETKGPVLLLENIHKSLAKNTTFINFKNIFTHYKINYVKWEITHNDQVEEDKSAYPFITTTSILRHWNYNDHCQYWYEQAEYELLQDSNYIVDERPLMNHNYNKINELIVNSPSTYSTNWTPSHNTEHIRHISAKDKREKQQWVNRNDSAKQQMQAFNPALALKCEKATYTIVYQTIRFKIITTANVSFKTMQTPCTSDTAYYTLDDYPRMVQIQTQKHGYTFKNHYISTHIGGVMDRLPSLLTNSIRICINNAMTWNPIYITHITPYAKKYGRVFSTFNVSYDVYAKPCEKTTAPVNDEGFYIENITNICKNPSHAFSEVGYSNVCYQACITISPTSTLHLEEKSIIPVAFKSWQVFYHDYLASTLFPITATFNTILLKDIRDQDERFDVIVWIRKNRYGAQTTYNWIELGNNESCLITEQIPMGDLQLLSKSERIQLQVPYEQEAPII